MILCNSNFGVQKSKYKLLPTIVIKDKGIVLESRIFYVSNHVLSNQLTDTI